MIRVLKDFKPANVTVEKGIDNAIKIRDMFIEEEKFWRLLEIIEEW